MANWHICIGKLRNTTGVCEGFLELLSMQQCLLIKRMTRGKIGGQNLKRDTYKHDQKPDYTGCPELHPTVLPKGHGYDFSQGEGLAWPMAPVESSKEVY